MVRKRHAPDDEVFQEVRVSGNGGLAWAAFLSLRRRTLLWSPSSHALLLTDEEMEICTDNFVKPSKIRGGFNFYRANLSLTSVPWTELDRTISNVLTTFLAGMGDTVVRSIWTDRVTNWYNNYTIEYVPDGGHFPNDGKPGDCRRSDPPNEDTGQQNTRGPCQGPLGGGKQGCPEFSTSIHRSGPLGA